MAPVRKSRSINKRFSNETSPENDVGSSSKSKQRKKMSNKLGPHWSKEELEHFYDAYRRHGPNWKKVAAAVRNNRSIEMVEALFNMNRAYLSLPEGTASVAGLVAMMTDHYNVMDKSDSGGEGRDASLASRKYQKRKRPKDLPSDSKDVLSPSQNVGSSGGCLPFLKQAQAYGLHRRATGKRTPRFPVPSSNWKDGRESCSPLNKKARMSLDSHDDVARFVALALSDASKKEWDDDSSKERRHEGEASDKNAASLRDKEGVGTVEVLRKGKKYFGKHVKVEDEGFYSDDSGEACSGTEGRKRNLHKGKVEIEVSTGKYSPHGQKKRRKKHIRRDEFDALQALAELSTSMLPENLIESESSAQLKEERTAPEFGDKAGTPEATSAGACVSNSKKPKFEKRTSLDNKSVAEGTSRKRKPKMVVAEAPMDSHRNKFMNKELAEEESKPVLKTKRAGQISPSPKQSKPVRMSEKSFPHSDQRGQLHDVPGSAPPVSALSAPKKPPNRRKMNFKKEIHERTKYPENTILSEQDLQKEKLLEFLSYPLARRWCNFEWFYSMIDYPWFAKIEFVDYLNHVGLGHVPRLTRLEWSVIKSSLGKPRRFSEKFLQEQREKLEQYRESVRQHYTELRHGVREGLPTDLSRPISVGNQVIAIHPNTREIHDGKILIVDHNKCSILFDRSDLGVASVADVECMPPLPLEYMPEDLRREVDNGSSMLKEAQQINGHLNTVGSVVFPSSRLENVPMNPLVKQENSNQASLQGASAANTFRAQQEAYHQSARRAVNLGLDKKELDPEMLGIFEGSRSKARAMVEAAVKVASSVKEEEDAYQKIREALDSIGEHQLRLGSKVQEHANGSLNHYTQSPSNTYEPSDNGFKSSDSLEKKESQMLSELITSCVATWLMIQRCTERQYPPADVAQLIDSAMTSLHPRCPQNLPLYREIQTCMGRIKTQILALVPT